MNKILIAFKCLLLCHQIHLRLFHPLDLQKSENKTYIYSLGNYSLGRKTKLGVSTKSWGYPNLDMSRFLESLFSQEANRTPPPLSHPT